MSDRLGKRQLRLMRSVGVTAAVIVPDRLTNSLVRRGLMAESEGGGFVHLTAAGLRALADAADRGEDVLFRNAPPAPESEGGSE